MWGGEIFVPSMPSYRVIDLAKAIDSKKKLKFIGIRSGEKIHESIITESDALTAVKIKDYYVICPNSEYINWSIEDYIKSKKGKKCNKDFFYDSNVNENFLSVSDLQKLLKNLKIN